jgi:hypothetical protein
MTDLPEKLNAQNLSAQLTSAELQNQLLQQTCKDLGVESFSISAGTPDFFNQMRQEIYRVMKSVIELQPHLLPNMIYRIDLNETSINKMLSSPHIDTAAELTEAILQREMKKIYIRNVFSGKL